MDKNTPAARCRHVLWPLLLASLWLATSARAQILMQSGAPEARSLTGPSNAVFQINIPTNSEIMVSLSSQSGCSLTFAHGPAASLSPASFSHAGTGTFLVSACTTNNASSWFFRVSQTCSSASTAFVLTATQVTKPCVQAVTTPAETRQWTYVYASDPWVYYSVSNEQSVEARVWIDAPSNSGPCSTSYGLYWRIGQRPTATEYDGLVTTTNSFTLTRWFSPCNLTGNLYLGIRGFCSGTGRANFTVRVDTYPQLCVTDITTLYANFSGWTRGYNPVFFRIPASLNYAQNHGILIEADASDGSGSFYDFTFGYAHVRAGALPTRTSYQKRGNTLGYSSCDYPTGDLFIGVFTGRDTLSGPDLSYAAQYSLTVTLIPGACYQPVTKGQLIPITLFAQYYWMTFGYTPSAAVTKARFVTCWNTIDFYTGQQKCQEISGYRAEWGRPTNISAPLVPSVTYDRCHTNLAAPDRTGQKLHVLVSGKWEDPWESNFNVSVIESQRPCTVEIPVTGGSFTESPIGVGQDELFSLKSVSGSSVAISCTLVSNPTRTCAVSYAIDKMPFNNGARVPPFTLQLTTGTTYFATTSSEPYTITFAVQAAPGTQLLSASSAARIHTALAVMSGVVVALFLMQ